ncbi:hypothetical protein FDF08_10885 [Micrococcus luteus]|nr:hypothetical protein FDF08_10885 [Micrococcus luteus]
MPASNLAPAHSDTLTVLEAAREYESFSPEYLRAQIRKGLLPAEKGRRGYLIRRADLDSHPGPAPGRPSDRDRLEAFARALVAQAPRFTEEQRQQIVIALEPYADGST